MTAIPTTEAQVPEEPAPVMLAPPRQLHTADGMASLIEEIRKRFGDTMGYELAISPDEAVLARPSPADDRSKLIYSFKGGWGDPDTRPRSDTDDVTDLGDISDPAGLGALELLVKVTTAIAAAGGTPTPPPPWTATIASSTWRSSTSSRPSRFCGARQRP